MFLSFLFVMIQFAMLGMIALTGPLFPNDPVLLALEFLGLGLGLWAIASMRLGNFNITPDVKETGQLVTAGPYALIRHPMYAALLLTTLPLVVHTPTGLRVLVWLVLLVDLVLKLNYEEGLLREALPGYADYQRESYRLVPFLY